MSIEYNNYECINVVIYVWNKPVEFSLMIYVLINSYIGAIIKADLYLETYCRYRDLI